MSSSTLDRLAVGDVIATYARALDTRNWELAKSQFTPGALAYEVKTPGPEAIVAMNRSRLAPCGPTMHFLGHQTVRFEGERAFAVTQVRAFHQGRGATEGITYEVMGEYHDELVKVGDRWLIDRRRFDRRLIEGDPGLLGPA